MEEGKPKLSSKDHLAIRKYGKRKIINAHLRIYNNVCAKCRVLIIRNPKRNVNDYCDKCISMIKETYKEIGINVE